MTIFIFILRAVMKLRNEKACDSVSLTYCGHNLFTRQWVVYKNCMMFVDSNREERLNCVTHFFLHFSFILVYGKCFFS